MHGSMQEDHRGEKAEVVLVNMPFAALFRPTIGLSLLKGSLASRGIPSRLLYFTIPLAERIGSELYVRLANQAPLASDLVGEWIFSAELFQDERGGFIDEILGPGRQLHGAPYNDPGPVSADFVEEVRKVRAMAADFLEFCACEVLQYSPRIVGFTSVFQQHVSSLALAKTIKARSPETFIVFGGSNCEGVMGAELARRFPFVDAVVSGEGDVVFPEIVLRVLNGKSVSDVPGIYTLENYEAAVAQGPSWSAAKVTDMDTLPVPDYDDFFLQHRESTLDPRIERQILFETSRGCWWGERSHCTFCGLSKESMAYRSKSQERALDEITFQAERYPGCTVTAVDNILDLKYFKEFIPGLAARRLNLQLFYETKANLKKEQVRLLREAGITMIQPGIESFSDQVLTLMGKGVKALQNIQLLKWCREFGIMPYWNILWGFPGEEPEEYAHTADLIPLLTHLIPPQCVARIRLDRFSPNFKFAEQTGFVNVRPYPAYYHVFALPEEAVNNLAYYFLYDYREPRDVAAYTGGVRQQVEKWWECQETSALFSVDKGSHLLIWDLRPEARAPLTVFTELQKLLYLSCDCICMASELKQIAEQYTGRSMPVQEVEELLQPALNVGLMLRENHSYLNLAVPLGVYSPPNSVMEKFYNVVRELGQSSAEGIEILLPEEQLATATG